MVSEDLVKKGEILHKPHLPHLKIAVFGNIG
jgi:hypothetical protein